MKIVLATHNLDKIKEIKTIMAPLDIELLHPEGLPDVVEDGSTLEENALKKAREIRDFTGLCALADDTGLEVDALGGAPGVYSSRFAGEDATYDDNNKKLLHDLDGVPKEQRTARFRCVMALALVNKERELLHDRMRQRGGTFASETDAVTTGGMIEGRIAQSGRGEAGFGFDPVFEVPKLGKTLAEMGLEAKNEISHRYRALVEMRELLLRYELAASRHAKG